MTTIYFGFKKNGGSSAYASRREECYPFPALNATSDQYYQVIDGSGQITQSNYPQIVQIGFGKDWKIDSGAYDPNKKQILLYLKDRWIGIFLDEPLSENRSINFTAFPCGRPENVLGFRWLLNRLESSVREYKLKGSLLQKNNRIQGNFTLDYQFQISDNLDIKLEINKWYEGEVNGEFYFDVKPGYPSNLPVPNLEEGVPIRGLW